MATSPISELVREQYERYPYPHYPYWVRVKPHAGLHAAYETGAALVHSAKDSARGKSILLLGCGTMEPLVMAALHPGALITAVDLSRRSLAKARARCFLHGQTKVRFVQKNLEDFCAEHTGQFDYVHCYGVLHHLEDPRRGFVALTSALGPRGFARIMVYSQAHRRRQNLLRDTLRRLGIGGQTSHELKTVKKLLDLLPLDHPFKAVSLLNSDHGSDSGLVDALLHACEHCFTLTELRGILEQAQLELRAWDLNAAMLDLLRDLPPTLTTAPLTQQISYLEAFSQWPGPFTFWVSRKTLASPGGQSGAPARWIMHPHFAWRGQRFFHSSLFRKKMRLTDAHRTILDAISVAPQGLMPSDGVNDGTSGQALQDLAAARLILRVGV